MFLHFFLLAAFNKNGTLFDNSTNGTSFIAPGLSDNFLSAFDNVTKDISGMTKPFQISPFAVKRSINESRTEKENLSHIVELTSTGPVKLNGTTTASAKTVKDLLNTAMPKDTQNLDISKKNEINKDNHSASESTTTSHVKSETTDSRRKIARNVFEIAIPKDSGELNGVNGSRTATQGNISSNAMALFPNSTKSQETTSTANRIPKSLFLDTVIFRDIERLVDDKRDTMDSMGHNTSESLGKAKTQEMANVISKVDDKKVMSTSPHALAGV